jgi:hypothetical protein
MDAGSDGRAGGRKILIVAAKTRDNRFALRGIDSHRLPADRMPGRQDHINAVGDMGVTVDFDHVNLIEDIRIIAVINRMRVF